MTEILFGVLTFCVTQIVKWIVVKFGAELGKNIILAVAFVVALILAYIQVSGIISQELLTQLTIIYGIAIGTYEVIYKRILLPIFDKIIAIE